MIITREDVRSCASFVYRFIWLPRICHLSLLHSHNKFVLNLPGKTHSKQSYRYIWLFCFSPKCFDIMKILLSWICLTTIIVYSIALFIPLLKLISTRPHGVFCSFLYCVLQNTINLLVCVCWIVHFYVYLRVLCPVFHSPKA